jgi:hypothetical protein
VAFVKEERIRDWGKDVRICVSDNNVQVNIGHTLSPSAPITTSAESEDPSLRTTFAL